MNSDEVEEYKNLESFDINNPENEAIQGSKKKGDNKTGETEKEKGCQFPTAYTILIIIELLIFILTYFIPKGKYDTIEYSSNTFIIKSYNKTDLILNATQSVLEEYKIKIPLENFEKGYIKMPISIPNTYQRIEGEKTNFLNLFLYPILGLKESCDISFFLMILGGITNVLIELKALSSGMAALSRLTRGKGFLLITLVFLLISVGGTTFGMLEEILAFYPILMPIFLKSGMDGLLSTASLYLGSVIGNMFALINAFSVVLSSNSAGISFIQGITFRAINYIIGEIITVIYLYFYYRKIRLDETKSLCYENKRDIEDKFLKENPENEKGEKEGELLISNELIRNKKEEFTCTQKLALFIFLGAFILMIVGVIFFDWWFEHMAAVFFSFSIILMFLLKKGEVKAIEAFTKGAGDFAGVMLIVGISRGINITLEDGKVSDTILYAMSSIITSMNKILFSILMFILFIFLGFFIQSYTGLAILATPVFAPLADNVSCSRTVVVNAYLFGQNFIGLIAPTGLILIVLQLTGVKYNQWLKLMFPFMIVMFIYLLILSVIDSFL